MVIKKKKQTCRVEVFLRERKISLPKSENLCLNKHSREKKCVFKNKLISMIYWRKNLLHIKLWWSTCLISSNTVSYKTLIQFEACFVFFFPLKDKHTEPWSIEIHLWNWIVYFLLSPVITTSGYTSRYLQGPQLIGHWCDETSWLLHIVTKGDKDEELFIRGSEMGQGEIHLQKSLSRTSLVAQW